MLMLYNSLLLGEIPYPINGTGKFPNNVEPKIIIKYKPTHIDGNFKFFGRFLKGATVC
jgi:hypothetical protein